MRGPRNEPATPPIPDHWDRLHEPVRQQVHRQSGGAGLPDNLRSGLESLSGHDLSDVRVHYNSGRPAQLGALAYTQGNDIHVAPGAQHHLPHEAAHVVQQRGGVAGAPRRGGAPIQDDALLERQADLMGRRAAGHQA